ncbi:MAG: 3-deoxy-D-manno-octulosonic acid transferase [Candidatus Omnitrophica bacterium]|nr:3-deoxy-D-manno-octulosonic acid transferase [Candidatus Omnitrophota bacterium]
MWMLYEILFVVGWCLYLPSALWRRRLPHSGWTMRLGKYPEALRSRLGGRPAIWVHAVSVGEILAVQPVLQAIRQAYPADPIVLSTITPGGYEVAVKRNAAQAIVVFFPLDLRWCVANALKMLRPRLLLLMESELWPMTIHLAKARGVPIALLNGRMSARTFTRYRWIAPWIGKLSTPIDLFVMQTHADADRLRQLGVPAHKIRVVGSLKWDASLGARPNRETLQQAAGRLGLSDGQSLIVAGSTHRGEEAAVLRAFCAARASHPSARLILAPRHLERLSEVEGLIRQAGLRPVRVSQGAGAAAWDVGVVDTFGQLPDYYGLASVVFVGGSLIPHGGQNPLEAASLGKPVIFGPSMHNFSEIVQQLTAHQAARPVANDGDLTRVLQELLAKPAEATAMGRRALALTERARGATGRTFNALRPLLRS